MRAIKQWWAWHSGPGRGSLSSHRSPRCPLPYWFVYLGTPPTWSIVTFPFSNSRLAASAAAHVELLLDPPQLLIPVAFHLQTNSSAKDALFVFLRLLLWHGDTLTRPLPRLSKVAPQEESPWPLGSMTQKGQTPLQPARSARGGGLQTLSPTYTRAGFCCLLTDCLQVDTWLEQQLSVRPW